MINIGGDLRNMKGEIEWADTLYVCLFGRENDRSVYF